MNTSEFETAVLSQLAQIPTLLVELQGVRGQLTELSTRVATIEGRVSELTHQVSDLVLRVGNVESRVSGLSVRIESIEERRPFSGDEPRGARFPMGLRELTSDSIVGLRPSRNPG